ncbi:hypothetical protein hbim_06510 [Mycolicibacterium mageritense]|uniref:Uncharacterized protein n=1 Tax=Mycolicibacterium mageritense TaxID=53462 RepID=A0AAI8U1P1_MYCME|nr:hypothetical protein hbim_06510 [Mycolicibacterium mageritense]
MGCNRGVRDALQQLPTYTARVSAIRSILAHHLPLADLVQNNRVANPIAPVECLAASWGATVTAVPELVVSVHHVEDFAEEVELLRYIAGIEDGSIEVARARADEFALVQEKLSTVQAVVGNCAVRIRHDGTALRGLVAPAIEIATTGWTAYTDDYVPPPLPPGADAPIWNV